MEEIKKIKGLLKKFTVGTMTITDVWSSEDADISIDVFDNGTSMWDENYFTRLYQSIYERITGELGPNIDPSLEIHRFMVNAGITGADVNVLASGNNVMPSFVRHQFVLPVKINDIPAHIQNDHFTIPHSTPHQVDKIIKSLVAQRIVPKKLQHMLDLFRSGTMSVKISESSNETIQVKYDLPENTELYVHVQPLLNYKLQGGVSFRNTDFLIKVHILDCDDYMEKIKYMNHILVKGDFERELLRAFERSVKQHKLIFMSPLHEINKMIRITGCDILNTKD